MTLDTTTQTNATSLDTKQLSAFIYQMNIVRRQVCTYPPEHQVVVTAAERTLKILKTLHDVSPQITIGVARDRLMIGAAPLDPRNPVYREYARAVFTHGVVALTLHRGLDQKELGNFCRLLSSKPDEMLARGGLVTACTTAGIRHITLTPLDSRQFRTRKMTGTDPAETAPDRMPAWERFVRSLLAPGADNVAIDGNTPAASPEDLARLLSVASCGPHPAGQKDYDQAITTFLRDLDRQELSWSMQDQLLDRFRTFINELQTPLRRQFLASTCFALGAHEERAKEVLKQFSSDALLDALKDLNRRQTDMPPFVLHLLHQLAPHTESRGSAAGIQEPTVLQTGAADGLALVFRKHHADDFVPQDYQDLLRKCPSRQTQPTLPPEVVDALKKSVHEQTMEQRLCGIVSHLLHYTGSKGRDTGLKKHLAHLIQHFIATGDFTALRELHHRLTPPAGNAVDTMPAQPVDIFGSYHFTREIVRALSSWPQEKQPEIIALIEEVGAPFVPLLLDSLAEAKERTLRYRYLCLLKGMGPAVLPELLKRLGDRRWYLLRNLLVLLNALGDPATIHAVRPLLRHPHGKVRQEALRTAFRFGDAGAEVALLKELNRPPIPPIWAVGLARHARGPRIFDRLLQLLAETDLSDKGLAVRLATVATLGQIGNPLSLPALEKVLFGFSLRHPHRHRRLQSCIIKSLKFYPSDTIGTLRRRLLRSMRPDLAELRHLLPHPAGNTP